MSQKNFFKFGVAPSEEQETKMKVLADMIALEIMNSQGKGFSLLHFTQHLEKSLEAKTAHIPKKKILVPVDDFGILSNLYLNWKHYKLFSREFPQNRELPCHPMKYDHVEVAGDMLEFGKFLCENIPEYKYREDYEQVGTKHSVGNIGVQLATIVSVGCYREWYLESYSDRKKSDAFRVGYFRRCLGTCCGDASEK